MEISKKELQSALEIVKPGLSNTTDIEQATSFAFMGDRIVTYNDEISISHPVEGLDLIGAIKAVELYGILGKLKTDTIDLTVSEKEVQLTSGKAKVWLTLESKIKLPIENVGSIKKWKALPENFISALAFVLPNVSHDMSKPVLTCVHVNNGGFIEACDNFRVARYLVEKIPVKTFLIPGALVPHVIRLNPVKIAEGEGWIHFRTEVGTIISCRIFEDDNFPDCSKPLELGSTQVELPQSFSEIVDRAIVFDKEFISVDVSSKKIKISSKSESGKFEESTHIRYAGSDFQFSINPQLLKGIIKQTLTCYFKDGRFIQFKDGDWAFSTILNAK
jgi:DNA polymerase III sliding clamp (beta) subunit (PCNA family)